MMKQRNGLTELIKTQVEPRWAQLKTRIRHLPYDERFTSRPPLRPGSPSCIGEKTMIAITTRYAYHRMISMLFTIL